MQVNIHALWRWRIIFNDEKGNYAKRNISYNPIQKFVNIVINRKAATYPYKN